MWIWSLRALSAVTCALVFVHLLDALFAFFGINLSIVASTNALIEAVRAHEVVVSIPPETLGKFSLAVPLVIGFLGYVLLAHWIDAKKKALEVERTRMFAFERRARAQEAKSSPAQWIEVGSGGGGGRATSGKTISSGYYDV